MMQTLKTIRSFDLMENYCTQQFVILTLPHLIARANHVSSQFLEEDKNELSFLFLPASE